MYYNARVVVVNFELAPDVHVNVPVLFQVSNKNIIGDGLSQPLTVGQVNR
jgi:hypothetical protein